MMMIDGGNRLNHMKPILELGLQNSSAGRGISGHPGITMKSPVF